MFLVKQIKEKLRTPTPLEVVISELEEAKLSLLEAESSVDFYNSIVRYNLARIERLEQHRQKEANK